MHKFKVFSHASSNTAVRRILTSNSPHIFLQTTKASSATCRRFHKMNRPFGNEEGYSNSNKPSVGFLPIRPWRLTEGSRPSKLDTTYSPTPAVSGAVTPSPREFTVATYNVLSQSHVEPNEYKGTPLQILDSASRHPHIAANIAALRPSLLCMQEADLPHALWVPVLNSMGYQCTFKLRRNRAGVTGEGLVLAWRASEWRCLAQAGVEYFSYPRVDADRKDQVAICALLQHRTTGQALVVADTHLVFNTNRGDIKLGQAQCLLRGVEAWLAHLGVSSPDLSALSLADAAAAEERIYGMRVCTAPAGRMETVDWNNYGAPLSDPVDKCSTLEPLVRSWIDLIKPDPVNREAISRVPDADLHRFRMPPQSSSSEDGSGSEATSTTAAAQPARGAVLAAEPLPPQALVVASPAQADDMYGALEPFSCAPLPLDADPCVIIGADMNSAPDSLVLQLFCQGRVDVECCRKHADGVEAYNRYSAGWRKAATWCIDTLCKAGVRPYCDWDIKARNDVLYGLRHPVPARVLQLCKDTLAAAQDKILKRGNALSRAEEAHVRVMHDLLAAHACGHEHAPSMPAWITAVSPLPSVKNPIAAGAGLVPMGAADVRAAESGLNVLTHDLGPLQNAYQGPHVPLAIRPSSCQVRGKTYVDHILYSKSLRKGADLLSLKAVLDLPDDRVTMRKDFNLPNSFEPSDHFPMMARFEFVE